MFVDAHRPPRVVPAVRPRRDWRSDRPRACGEYDGIISMPSSRIALPNCVGFDLSTPPPAFGVRQ